MPNKRTTNVKRAFAQSTYITTGWNWFMILAGKAAEPVLVMSVLYASVKLLPIVHFPPQFDVAVFIAQFVALDIGGLSLNKLADQAKKEGNEEGAKHARHLSIALVGIMLVGVIMAGVDQIIKLDGQVGTVIDTILLIARAVMAVLYSRVIHSLKKDDEPEPPSEQEIDELVTEKISAALQGALTTLRQEIVSQLTANLSQALDERLTALDMKQTGAFVNLRDEQATLITETVTNAIDTTLRKRAVSERPRETKAIPSKVRSITEAPSRQRNGTQEIDKIIWPLLNTGMTIRAIALRANTSTATVGRSRQRWEAAQKSVSPSVSGETAEEA